MPASHLIRIVSTAESCEVELFHYNSFVVAYRVAKAVGGIEEAAHYAAALYRHRVVLAGGEDRVTQKLKRIADGSEEFRETGARAPSIDVSVTQPDVSLVPC